MPFPKSKDIVFAVGAAFDGRPGCVIVTHTSVDECENQLYFREV